MVGRKEKLDNKQTNKQNTCRRTRAKHESNVYPAIAMQPNKNLGNIMDFIII